MSTIDKLCSHSLNYGKGHFFHVHVLPRLKKIQEKKKIIRKKAEEAKKAKGITNGKTQWVYFFYMIKQESTGYVDLFQTVLFL